MKTKEQKQQDIVQLKEAFSDADNALIVTFQGLTVEKDWELRRALEKAELNYRVVKNTLVKIAVEGTPLEPLKDHFTGMTAVAYSQNDPVGKLIDQLRAKERGRVPLRELYAVGDLELENKVCAMGLMLVRDLEEARLRDFGHASIDELERLLKVTGNRPGMNDSFTPLAGGAGGD